MKVYQVINRDHPEEDCVCINRSFWTEGFSLEQGGLFLTLVAEGKINASIDDMVETLVGRAKEPGDNEYTPGELKRLLQPIIDKGYLVTM